jgi:hypothetical protein
MPHLSQLQTELAMLPRDAYFAEGEHVLLERAVGRIAAEKVTPYPPGIPVLVPGERLTQPIVEYLRAGVEIGMNITDVADSKLETVRSLRGERGRPSSEGGPVATSSAGATTAACNHIRCTESTTRSAHGHVRRGWP